MGAQYLVAIEQWLREATQLRSSAFQVNRLNYYCLYYYCYITSWAIFMAPWQGFVM